jgi:hypothetical protein
MNGLLLLSTEWQTVAPVLLIISGAPLLVIGLRREWDGLRRPLRDPAKVITWVRGFRLSMIGFAFSGAGAGWLLDQTWLVVLSLAIGGEETLESSIMHFALTRGRDLRITIGPRA